MQSLARSADRPVQRAKLRGLIAAPFTPMLSDGTLDLDRIEPYCEWLHQRGVAGAFVCGTTGESASLTVNERLQIASRWAQVVPNGFKLIVHVGHTCLADAQQLAMHAQDIDADSIGCVPPFFFKPEGVAATVDWSAAVAQAAPELPFYYYHIPSMTGLTLSIAAFLAAAGAAIPTLAGVKFTYEDLDDFAAAVALENNRYDVLFGRDELFLQGCEAGAEGAVGSTYNFAAPLYHEILSRREIGARADAVRLQGLATAMVHAIVRGGPSPVATMKATMALAGFECGPARQPLTNPTTTQIRALRDTLATIGIDHLIGSGNSG